MGYLAAVCESLLQSHVPGHLVLLPSLSQVMASQGGSIEGLRARGNAIVSISWMPLKRVKDSIAPVNSTRNRGGKGLVHKATILFRAPHPWFKGGGPGPNGGNSNSPIVEDLPGFFSFSKASHGDGPWTRGPISEVIIVYPESKRPLRLAGSYRQDVDQVQGLSSGAPSIDVAVNGSRRRTSTHTADSPLSGGSSDTYINGRVNRNRNRNMNMNETSSYRRAKLGVNNEGERSECARVIPALSLIPSANITIAANPKKHSNTVPSAAAKRNLDDKSTPRNYIRQGIGIQIFDFPCKILLRS